MANVSNAEALNILQHANDTSYRTAQQGVFAGELATLGAKKQSLDATIKEAQAAQKDSLVKFGSTGVGTILNTKLAMYGNGQGKSVRQMKDEADAKFAERQTRQAAIRASALSVANGGNNLGTIVDKTTEALSQTAGPQADIHAAQIDQKLADVASTSAQNQLDSFKSTRDSVTKAQDGVNDLAKTLYERAAQVVSRTFG